MPLKLNHVNANDAQHEDVSQSGEARRPVDGHKVKNEDLSGFFSIIAEATEYIRNMVMNVANPEECSKWFMKAYHVDARTLLLWYRKNEQKVLKIPHLQYLFKYHYKEGI